MNKFKGKSTNKGSNKFDSKTKSQGKRTQKGTASKGIRDEAAVAESENVKLDSMPVGKPRPTISNDPGWYEKIQALSANVGTLYFSEPAGKSFRTRADILYCSDAGSFTTKANFTKVDSTMVSTIYYMPTWGEGKDATSAINVMCYRLLWKLVGKQVRNTSYTAGDIGQLLINMDSVYIMLYEAIRAYGLLNKFSVTNFAFGETMVNAAGWNWAKTRPNMANLRYYINQTIHRLNSIHIPKEFSIMSRHSVMYQAIYADVPSDKAQYYLFTAGGYWQFSDEEAKTSFVKRPITLGGTPTYWDPDTWYNAVTQQLDAILASDFQAIMDADIMRAFGESEMIQFPYMADDYTTEPIYDPLMLIQISNMEWVPFINDPADFASDSKQFDCSYTTVPKEGSTRVDLLQSVFRFGNRVNSVEAISPSEISQITAHMSPGLLWWDGNTKLLNLPSSLGKTAGVILEATRLMFSVGERTITKNDKGIGEWWMGVVNVCDGWCYGIITRNATYKDVVDNATTTIDTFGLRPVVNNDSTLASSVISDPSWGKIVAATYQYAIAPAMWIVTSSTNQASFLTALREIQDRVLVSKEEFEHLNYVATVSLWDWQQLYSL